MSVISHFFVSVVAVLSDDSDILEKFFEETISVLKSSYQHYEIILVDNGSQDETSETINGLLKEHESVRYIRLSRKFKTEAAISAGLDSAIGDVIVVLEPQMDPPSLIPDMVERLRQSKGVVFGVRRKSIEESILCKVGRKIFYGICKLIMKFPPPENATYFMGLARQSLNAIIQIKDQSRFIRIFGGYVGFKKESFEYDQRCLREKRRQESLVEKIRYAVNIIISNTMNPLVFVSYLGLFASLLNFAYIGYLFAVAISKESTVEGWLSTSMQTSLMFLFAFIILTVLCEYISRIFDEIKHRPAYFIEDEKNSSVLFSDEDRKNIVRD